jgi:hypothetical protein
LPVFLETTLGYAAAKVFNGDIGEIRCYNVALPTNECLAISQDLGIKYALILPGFSISNFTANPPAVNAGQSTTLSWQVATNAGTGVTISGIGDVTAKTTNGIGSLVVTPAKDTLYTLIITNSHYSASAAVRVDTHQTAAGSLLDSFLASDLTALGNGGQVTTWTSHSGLHTAIEDSAFGTPATFVASGSNGKPTVKFEASPLRLAAADTIVAGYPSWTIAIVFQPDPLNPPTQPTGPFFGEVGLLGGDIGGSAQPDAGFGISSNGIVNFTTGGAVGDNSLQSISATLNGNYHVVVGTLGTWSGVMAEYVDGNLEAIMTTNIITTPSTFATGLVIGGNTSSTTTQAYNGNIAEISFYGDDLQTNQIAALIVSLAAKYNIDLTKATGPITVVTTGPGFGFTAPGHFTLTWNASFGAHYTIWKKAALTGPWTNIGTATNSANSMTLQFIDTAAAGVSAFYRISSP